MRSATHPISPIRSKWAPTLAMDLITLDTPVRGEGKQSESECGSGGGGPLQLPHGHRQRGGTRLALGLSPDLDSLWVAAVCL